MQGSCYKFSSSQTNWDSAKAACEALGSHLVVINSQAEQQAIAANVNVHGWRTWIGMRRDPQDRSLWLWVDGSRPTFTHWYSGEPNDLGGEDCTEMYPERLGWRWNDDQCSTSLRYICEINGRSK